MIYKNLKQAISDKANIPKTELRKLKVLGLMNEGIFASKDRIYKIVSCSREAKAAIRLIGKNFKNVVKIYNVYDFTAKLKIDTRPWHGYIIEQEKLFCSYKDLNFLHLPFASIANNPERAEYINSIANGIKELLSLGICHKDLHQSNIMLSKDNNLKIIDFSIVNLKRFR